MNKDDGLKLLKDVKHINQLIEQLTYQIEEIYSMLTSTTVKPKTMNIQVSKNSDPLATQMAKVLEYKEKLETYKSELCAKKTEVLDVLQHMEMQYQSILVMRYFNLYTIEEIGQRLNRSSYYHTWQLVHRAEEEFCEIYSKK